MRFAFIGSLQGVRCVLDGVTKYSDSGGFCSFFGVSQGAHTYSVSKEGYTFIEGQDPFKRPLSASGTTVIEWAPVPGIPWPEAQPWLMLITLEAIGMGEFAFDAWNPPFESWEVKPVKSEYAEGESVYIMFCVKNVGETADKGTITVKDLDTEETIATFTTGELDPTFRWKTAGSHAYVGKMPDRDWRLHFEVNP